MPIRVGLVGAGRIAIDQHVPALRADPGFALVACASLDGTIDGIANFISLDAMLGAVELDAVAICTPPAAHHEIARSALRRGKHVLLEKPPCVTLAELEDLIRLACEHECTLFLAWHARFAAAVERARAWLDGRRIGRARIVWKEDARKWHPGQTWLWRADGFGVLDPGINALSILTRLTDSRIAVRSARLFIPANCASPVAVDLELSAAAGLSVIAEFDFRHEGKEAWTIAIETDGGLLALQDGGASLVIDGMEVAVPPQAEYPALYRRFSDLVERGESDADAAPFRLVLDALRIGKRFEVEAFEG